MEKHPEQNKAGVGPRVPVEAADDATQQPTDRATDRLPDRTAQSNENSVTSQYSDNQLSTAPGARPISPSIELFEINGISIDDTSRDSLLSDSPLSLEVVDAGIHVLCKHGSRRSSNSVKANASGKSEIGLVGAVHLRGHFRLLFINFFSRAVYIFDSFAANKAWNKTLASQACTNLNQIFSQYNGDGDFDFKPVVPSSPQQLDNNSCGLATIFFAECIINGMFFDRRLNLPVGVFDYRYKQFWFKPRFLAAYRVYVWRMLVHSANSCYVCGHAFCSSSEQRESCIDCNAIYHNSCSVTAAQQCNQLQEASIDSTNLHSLVASVLQRHKTTSASAKNVGQPVPSFEQTDDGDKAVSRTSEATVCPGALENQSKIRSGSAIDIPDVPDDDMQKMLKCQQNGVAAKFVGSKEEAWAEETADP